MRLKAELITNDFGKTWLVTRQWYIADIENSEIIEDLNYQGREFKLESEDDSKGPSKPEDENELRKS
jgi:hypothetical protein